MTQIVIDKKKYVLLPEKEYLELQKKAALKSKPAKALSLAEGRKLSHKLIDKWNDLGFLTELQKREKAYKSGAAKMYTLDESVKRARHAVRKVKKGK